MGVRNSLSLIFRTAGKGVMGVGVCATAFAAYAGYQYDYGSSAELIKMGITTGTAVVFGIVGPVAAFIGYKIHSLG